MTRHSHRHVSAALASSPFLRGAKITVRGSMDGIAVYITGKHGAQSIYLDRAQAAALCFKLHGAIQEHLRANGSGRHDR